VVNKSFLILPLVAILATSANAVNLVVNGDFETDAFAGHSTLSSLSGWNINSIGNVAGVPVGYISAPSQQVDLSGFYDGTGGSGINQTVTTVASGAYSVKFDVYTPFNGTVSFKLNNNLVATGLTTGTYSYTFTGTGADNIDFISDYGNTTHLDNVSVQAVPEPITMFTLGAGALALVRRRRNAK
jgi:hypothetical protein